MVRSIVIMITSCGVRGDTKRSRTSDIGCTHKGITNSFCLKYISIWRFLLFTKFVHDGLLFIVTSDARYITKKRVRWHNLAF